MFKRKKINLSTIKKLLIEKGFVIKKKKNFFHFNDLRSFYYTILSSFVIILISFFIPFSVDIGKNIKANKSTVDNNSSLDFQKVLDGKSLKNENTDEGLNIKNLFEDIFSFEEVPTDTVRLSASTIDQLFKETNYNLDDVRKTKLVKPIRLSLLPGEIKKIESTQKKKNLFIQIVLPLILEENNRIKLNRKKLFNILNKNINTAAEKRWLNSKFKQYGVLKKDLSTLKIRMDEVPVSLAIAQAAKETGWGTSRFAIEGNALFGQWTWTGEGIKPAGIDSDDTTHKVMKFKVLKASVRAYQRNLNTHGSYRKFRSIRAEMRDNDEQLDSLILANYLDKYAATGKEYTKIIKQIIKQNFLKDFDKVKLLPSSIQLKNLI
ncbi:MAG: glucosaminidase domain-containing protein [Pelagibacterales bacterium]|nr:glucosaminidase domain-containing protein [Pelagibacterales bacterium]